VPKSLKYTLLAVLLAAVLYIPYGVPERSWLTPLNLAAAAAVGAIGLNILLGFTGQLSLAHPFFLAIGAYGYTFLSADHDPITKAASAGERLRSLGLHPLVSAAIIIVVAGLFGGLLSPIAGRLKGIYLGIATLGLVFLTDHILQNVKTMTGGFNGRRVPVMDLGFTKINECRPKACSSSMFGSTIKWGSPEKLWYFQIILVVLAFILARNMMKGRPGRALMSIRDGETAASVMGVNLTRYRAYAFILSAMFAGLSGVMYALANGNVTPPEFGVDSGASYLAMVVIGGVGSLVGPLIGAFFVKMLPDLIQRNSETLSWLVAGPNDPSGLKPLSVAKFIYGGLIILLLLFEDGGLAGLVRRIRHRSAAGAAKSGADTGGSSDSLTTNHQPGGVLI
jgi:branched-chain amino acid transport system permease protein